MTQGLQRVSMKTLVPLVVVIPAVFAGCAGEKFPSLSSASGGTAASAVDGSAPSILAKDTSAPAFDPFNTVPATSGARDVIQMPTLEQVLQSGDLPEVSVGRADAPVTIIKYASLTCPYCKKFQAEIFPQLKREFIDTGKVRLLIREFPIGFQSGAATIAMRCASPDKQLELYEKLLATQVQWVSQEVRHDPIFKIAATSGITRAEFDACYKNQPLLTALNKVKERGRNLGIVGTPNFFVGTKLIKGTLEMAQIRELVTVQLGSTASAGDRVVNPSGLTR
jgi:protein-disulfide isomerase